MSYKHNAAHIDTAVFDLGNVIIRWNPRNLYRILLGVDIEAMESFLALVCPTAWNEQQDQG
ncbi:HAD family phosphatase, partial [Pseudomonas sp. Dout3]|nr:HAD family phosphatase [Pseudomonas sp. Dout3]